MRKWLGEHGKMKKWFFIIIFLALQAGLIYSALSKPGTLLGELSGMYAHFGTFFLLSVILSLLLSELGIKFGWLYAFIYSVLCAVAVEFLQKWFTTYRVFDYVDMATGGFGGLVGAVSVGFGLFLIKRMKTDKKNLNK